jgi:hypothetical protein
LLTLLQALLALLRAQVLQLLSLSVALLIDLLAPLHALLDAFLAQCTLFHPLLALP